MSSTGSTSKSPVSAVVSHCRYNPVHVHAYKYEHPSGDDSTCECGASQRSYGADTLIGYGFVEQKAQSATDLPTEFIQNTCRGLISRVYEHAASNDSICQYRIKEPGSAITGAVEISAAMSAFDIAGHHSIQPFDPLRMTIHPFFSDAEQASRQSGRRGTLDLGSASLVANTALSRRHFGVKPDGTGLKDGTLMPGADGTICGRKDASNVNAEEKEDVATS